MKRKTTVIPFRFNLPDKAMYTALMAACQVEINYRRRDITYTPSFCQHIAQISKWLTSSHSSFGLFLCGSKGNGKTTIVKAVQSLYQYVRRNTPYRSDEWPKDMFLITTAKDVVRAAREYNNRCRDRDNCYDYSNLLNSRILCIDDMGTEPRESVQFGEFLNPVTDIINYRYENQLTTIITSNLSAGDIAECYDERLADRLKEMMEIVNFSNDPSFR